MRETPKSVIYRIDLDDRLTYLNPGWVSFARDNDAPELTHNSLIGQHLWGFIDGQEVQHLYRLVLAKVRRVCMSATVPFRCDSPTMRRYMELEIAPLPENELQFEVRTLKVEPRDAVSILDASVSRSDKVLVICSSCKRILNAGDEWLNAEEVIARLGLFDTAPLPHLSNGVCPLCRDRIERALSRI